VHVAARPFARHEYSFCLEQAGWLVFSFCLLARCRALSRSRFKSVPGLTRTTATCALLLLLSACGSKSKLPAELSWSEEVRLTSGEIILVDRREHYHTTRELAGYGELRVDSSDIVIHPAGNNAPLPTVTVAEFPIVADYDALLAQWYVITLVDICEDAKQLNLGTRPYLEYRLRDGVWSRAQIEAGRVGHPSNLLQTKSLVTKGNGGVIRVDAKELRDHSVEIPDIFRSIVPVVPCPF